MQLVLKYLKIVVSKKKDTLTLKHMAIEWSLAVSKKILNSTKQKYEYRDLK